MYFSFMCALSILITKPTQHCTNTYTQAHMSVFVCVDDRLCPIVISWCAYKVLVYLELLHFCAYVIYFQTSF